MSAEALGASVEKPAAEQAPKPLKDLRAENRAKVQQGMDRLKSGLRKVGGFLEEKALDVGAAVLTAPEMGRRAKARMAEVGEQNAQARTEVLSALGKKGREEYASMVKQEFGAAKAKLGEFAAEHWHWSKRNIEKREKERERVADEKRLAFLAEVVRMGDDLMRQVAEAQREAIAEKMKLEEKLRGAFAKAA